MGGVYPPEDAREYLKRFYREARAAAFLYHPTICVAYDVGESDAIDYLTPDRTSMLRTEIAPALETVVVKGMAKKPGDRYFSMTPFEGASTSAWG